MKVNDPNAAGISSSQLGQVQRPDEAAGKRTSEAGRSTGRAEDRVQLSDLAGSLQELSAAPEREELIDRLAAEYREGRYKADPAETSRALIAEALEKTES